MSAGDRLLLERFSELYDKVRGRGRGRGSDRNRGATNEGLLLVARCHLPWPFTCTPVTPRSIASAVTPRKLLRQYNAPHTKHMMLLVQGVGIVQDQYCAQHAVCSLPPWLSQAEIYYAYDLIHNAVASPFKSTHPSTLFNVSRFLLMRTLNREPPPGVSIANIVYILAKHSMELKAYKLARFAYNKLQVRGGGQGGGDAVVK